MSRKLRPDTFNKQVNHLFRTNSGLNVEGLTIKRLTGPWIRDAVAGFEEYEPTIEALVIRAKNDAHTRIGMQRLWSGRESTIAEAQQTATNIANTYKDMLEHRISEKTWPDLTQLAQLYADLARYGGAPIKLMLPRQNGKRMEFEYPRIDMTFGHYATSVMSYNRFDDRGIFESEIEKDAAVFKKLKRHILDRTTIDELTLAVLQADDNFKHHLELLLKHQEVLVGPFTIRNVKEHISIQPSTWNTTHQWIEYVDGTLGIRDVQLPLSVQNAMTGQPLDSIVEGMPAIGKATIAKATNPKNYVMNNRPRVAGQRNDAPTLRLKLVNNSMTLRKGGVTWDGESPTHQAIAEAEGYIATLPGPFASRNAEENLEKLLEIARGYRLLPPRDVQHGK